MLTTRSTRFTISIRTGAATSALACAPRTTSSTTARSKISPDGTTIEKAGCRTDASRANTTSLSSTRSLNHSTKNSCSATTSARTLAARSMSPTVTPATTPLAGPQRRPTAPASTHSSHRGVDVETSAVPASSYRSGRLTGVRNRRTRPEAISSRRSPSMAFRRTPARASPPQRRASQERTTCTTSTTPP